MNEYIIQYILPIIVVIAYIFVLYFWIKNALETKKRLEKLDSEWGKE